MSEHLRDLPSVEHLLQLEPTVALVSKYGRPQTVEAVRAELAQVRADLQAQSQKADHVQVPDPVEILQHAEDTLETWMHPTLQPVINASGVILHTNLGRAPLSKAAVQAMQEVALGYSNLEYDLEHGKRGSRLVHAEALLQRLTGAEAALVVNNNAAALLLALTALARRQRVVISRSQLIEIGGGFRIPEVMSQSGAKLVEVGTTNRVHPRDYEEALQQKPAAMLLRAHHSNFRIVGFTTEPSLTDLAQIAHRYGVLLLDDLGSGVFLNTENFGLAHEPTVQESLQAGADLVCFSGDKLLGGPQAGILLGQSHLIAKLKKYPLARAVRADKLCLAALTATLLHYLKDEAEREVPIWQMIAATPERLRERASHWAVALHRGSVIAGQSTIGGGSLPEETLPTYLLALDVARPNHFVAKLRAGSPPIVARVEADQVLFDPRTVFPEQEDALLAGVQVALS